MVESMMESMTMLKAIMVMWHMLISLLRIQPSLLPS